MTRISAKLPYLYIIIVYLFLISPLIVVVVVSFNASPIVRFPPEAFSLTWYKRALVDKDFIDSFVLSLVVAVSTSVLALLVGTLLSMAIVRYRFPGRTILRALSIAPLAFPHIVLGLALLSYFIMIGVGLRLETLILGHLVVTLPFVVQVVSATLYGFDRSLEEAARTLGAGPILTFWKVTIPTIFPGMLTAGLFAFILSFDNVGISLFLSSGARVTVPVRMFQYVESQYDPTIAAISTFLVLFGILVVFVLVRFGALEKVFSGRGGSYTK